MTIIEAAKQYLGTPYKAQGRENDLDCGGFVVRVFRDAGYEIADLSGYSKIPDGESFERILLAQCAEIEKTETRIGDILAFDLQKAGMVSHIGICSQIEPYIKIIHCLESGGTTGVVDHRLMPGTALFRGWYKTYRKK